MHKNRPFIPIILTACVIMIACLLIFGCLTHVLSHDGTQDMYSISSVRAHFSSFGWIYAGLIAVIAILSFFAKKSSAGNARAKEYRREKASKPRTKRILRICFFALSAVLIMLGIVNGGLYDVFVKAVNICTECIGLG